MSGVVTSVTLAQQWTKLHSQMSTAEAMLKNKASDPNPESQAAYGVLAKNISDEVLASLPTFSSAVQSWASKF